MRKLLTTIWLIQLSFFCLCCGINGQEVFKIESAVEAKLIDLDLEAEVLGLIVNEDMGLVTINCLFKSAYYLGDGINEEIFRYVFFRIDSLVPVEIGYININYSLEGLNGVYMLSLERAEIISSWFGLSPSALRVFEFFIKNTDGEDVVAYNMLIEDIERYTDVSFRDLGCQTFICFLSQYDAQLRGGSPEEKEVMELRMAKLIKAASYPRSPQKPEVLTEIRRIIDSVK